MSYTTNYQRAIDSGIDVSIFESTDGKPEFILSKNGVEISNGVSTGSAPIDYTRLAELEIEYKTAIIDRQSALSTELIQYEIDNQEGLTWLESVITNPPDMTGNSKTTVSNFPIISDLTDNYSNIAPPTINGVLGDVHVKVEVNNTSYWSHNGGSWILSGVTPHPFTDLAGVSTLSGVNNISPTGGTTYDSPTVTFTNNFPFPVLPILFVDWGEVVFRNNGSGNSRDRKSIDMKVYQQVVMNSNVDDTTGNVFGLNQRLSSSLQEFFYNGGSSNVPYLTLSPTESVSFNIRYRVHRNNTPLGSTVSFGQSNMFLYVQPDLQ